LLVTKSAIRPGSNFNRQGGSIFHQRQHLTLRTALNMTFIGTDDAAYAACFAEKYIPYGKSLSDESRDEIRKVIGRLKAQKSPVFSREHLMDDMGL